MIAVVCLASGLLLRAADSHTEQGIAAFSRGDYSIAAGQLQDALAQNPADEHARAFLVLTRAATGHREAVIADLDTLWQKGANPDLRRLAGLTLVQCHLNPQR